jgi:histone H3/H4
MNRFSYHHCHRILREAGAKQASYEASEELCKTLENIALDISRRAVLFADDNARLKVTREDVKSAYKEFLRSASFASA